MSTREVVTWPGRGKINKPVTIPVPVRDGANQPIDLPNTANTAEAIGPDGNTRNATVTEDAQHPSVAFVNFANSEITETGKYEFDLLINGEVTSFRYAFWVDPVLGA